jgi:hypothetical protein
MPDTILATLVGVIAALHALHVVDPILRGEVHEPLDRPSVAFVLITVVTSRVLGCQGGHGRTPAGAGFWGFLYA